MRRGKQNKNTIRLTLPQFQLWEKVEKKRHPLSMELEITARCNHSCRHCYINLPENDPSARSRELTLTEIEHLAGEAQSLGTLWCLITGGEPLLREDFFDIYLLLRKMGFLITIFTNATLITGEHARFFKKYPPRNFEVTVYGANRETYEKITHTKDSFQALMNGLYLLDAAGIRVRLKAMALRSNIHEFDGISRFCRERTGDYFRFDPFLHLRYDGDAERNRDIISERLTNDEIIRLEQADKDRFKTLAKTCERQKAANAVPGKVLPLLRCGAGQTGFCISWHGLFRLCASLYDERCLYDLRKGSLSEAWQRFAPDILSLTSSRPDYLNRCYACRLVNLCQWCPAHAFLESDEMDAPVDEFCITAHKRARMLEG